MIDAMSELVYSDLVAHIYDGFCVCRYGAR